MHVPTVPTHAWNEDLGIHVGRMIFSQVGINVFIYEKIFDKYYDLAVCSV